ncbi:MAG: SDR family oxidoreductase [Planctomycetaceae bacterium]
MTLQDKVVIITGASAGIGHEIAQRLAEEKAVLVLAARSEDKLQQLSDQLAAVDCQTLVVRTDVSDPNDLNYLVDTTMAKFGRIDVLINNAGVECFRHFERAEMEEILQTIEINLTGAIMLTRLVIPHMLQQKSGAIINMASTAGKHCPAYGSVYGATKAGLIAFTQGLRGEYLKLGITSTAICPGFTTSGGVYDRIVEVTGRKTSLALGGTSTKAVANAVVKAIEKAPPELIINWPPVRPAMVLREIFPRLGEMLTTAVSKSFVRRAADAADSRKG